MAQAAVQPKISKVKTSNIPNHHPFATGTPMSNKLAIQGRYLWDTEWIQAGEKITTINFFQRPLAQGFFFPKFGNKYETHTSLNQSSMLDYPTQFVAHGIGIHVGHTASDEDRGRFIDEGMIEMCRGGRHPIFRAPLCNITQVMIARPKTETTKTLEELKKMVACSQRQNRALTPPEIACINMQIKVLEAIDASIIASNMLGRVRNFTDRDEWINPTMFKLPKAHKINPGESFGVKLSLPETTVFKTDFMLKCSLDGELWIPE
jgi:hypothetical protein